MFRRACVVVWAGSLMSLLAVTADAQSPRRPRVAPAALGSLTVTVADGRGAPLEGVSVVATGPTAREAVTDSQGRADLLNLRAGTYRLRFDAPGWVSLERDVTVAARTSPTRAEVQLSPAPPVPVPEPCPPPSRLTPVPDERPVGEVRVTTLAAADREPPGSREALRVTTYGCTGYATTRVLEVRESYARTLSDADESLYVVAGQGTVTVDGRPFSLAPGALAVLPRGRSATFTREGRGPLVLVSVLSGPACTASPP